MIEDKPPIWLFELLVSRHRSRKEPEGRRGHATRASRRHSPRPVARLYSTVANLRGFGFKWAKRETFEASHVRERTRRWLIARYGEIEGANWWSEYGESPVVLDAGCGAAYSAVELLASRLHRLRYVGMDISPAVDVAAQRFSERGLPGAFIQADLMQPPFADARSTSSSPKGSSTTPTRQNWR